MDFYEQTSAPENYNYFTFGLEGRYWNMVDGFPQLTEEGKKDVTGSFYSPYVLATDLYNKVDSPLAPPEYNRESREMCNLIDEAVDKFGKAPFQFFEIIESRSWSQVWAMEQNDFNSLVVEVISGKKTVDELRAYQQQLLKRSEVQTAMKEFKQSWDEFGLSDWKPSTM
jgi:hypothetical protein